MSKKRFLMVMLLVFVGLLSACGASTLESFLQTLKVDSEVSGNLDLKNEYIFDGKIISVEWTSTNEQIITNTGEITRTTYDQQAILTAKASLNGQTASKNFTITVLADNTSMILESAATNASIGLSMILDQVKGDITLPLLWEQSNHTVVITWSSSDETIIKPDGKVSLPKKNTTVQLTATYSLNGLSIQRTYDVLVIKDPNYSLGAEYSNLSVYTGVIENEITPNPVGKFDGAIYRKVVSSRDYWLGIEFTVTLPEYTGDPNRMSKNPYGSENDMRYNDNASVYMGASGNAESDVGLSWSMGINPTTGKVDYSKSIGFRPFWRYIDSGQNIYRNASVYQPEYYYYPGDTVKMSLYVSKDGYLQLRIELLEETTIPEYVAVRESYNLGDYNKVFLSEEFPSSGAGVSKIMFKRCCALDQVGNEGGRSQPTNAKSLNIIYHEVYLYREINGELYKVPMTSDRRSELSWPGTVTTLGDFTNAIKVSYEGVNTSLGGEVVSIDPQNGQ